MAPAATQGSGATRVRSNNHYRVAYNAISSDQCFVLIHPKIQSLCFSLMNRTFPFHTDNFMGGLILDFTNCYGIINGVDQGPHLWFRCDVITVVLYAGGTSADLF